MAAALLLEHRLVEREPRAAHAGPSRLDVDREHHALRDLEVAGEQTRHRRFELVGLDLGEVAELADVDAEDRHRRRVHEVDRAQHRAVAAERDDEIEPVGEARRRRPRVVEPGRVRLGVGHAHLDAAARNQPAAARAQLVREPRGRDAARARPLASARAHAATRARRRRRASIAAASTVAAARAACAKNSTLPSAPRSGDVTSAATPSPCASSPSTTSRSTARAPRGRGRRRPCRRGPGPPRTAASPAARNRRRRW